MLYNRYITIAPIYAHLFTTAPTTKQLGDDYTYEYHSPVQNPIRPPYETALRQKRGQSTTFNDQPLAIDTAPDTVVKTRAKSSSTGGGVVGAEMDKANDTGTTTTSNTNAALSSLCYSYEDMMTNVQYLNIVNKSN